MAVEQKIAFVFLPRRPSVEAINTFISELLPYFPNAEIMIAMSKRPEEDMGILYKNSHVVVLNATNKRLDIVSGGSGLMNAAIDLHYDWLFFNTGLMRYNIPTFVSFVKKAQDHQNNASFVYGVPPILQPSTALPEELATLEIPKVRWRILTDIFLSYTFSRALNKPFTNTNAGLFGINGPAMEYLCSAKKYQDSSLLCSLIFWQLSKADRGFRIRPIELPAIHLEDLSFKMDKAVKEIAFAFKVCRGPGNFDTFRSLASDFFAERAYWKCWVTSVDQEQFDIKVASQVEALLQR